MKQVTENVARALPLLSGLLLVGCGTVSTADSAKYRELTLSNEAMTVVIKLPTVEEGYRNGTRFDTSGLVSKVKVGRRNFLGHQFGCPDPWLHSAAGGLAGEFTEPLGYDEAKVGDTFIKIGVGHLTRTIDKPYKFWNKYELTKPGQWVISEEEHAVTFKQVLTDERGWGYVYSKTVSIGEGNENTVTIRYELKNIGIRTIDTMHYCHNFIRIRGRTPGPDYKIELGFEVDKMDREMPADKARVDGNRIELKTVGAREAVYNKFTGFGKSADDNTFFIELDDGSSVRIKGDTPIARFDFFANAYAICPEAFIQIKLKPGDTKTWSNHYNFVASPEKK